MDRRRILLIVAVVVAALGAGLVFLYAQGAEDRASDKGATVNVLVATQDIRAGESAEDAANAGKLLSKAIPKDDVVPGATNDGSVFKDQVALTTIYQGEQLIPSKFGNSDQVQPTQLITPPKGKGSMSVSISDPNNVGAFLQPGSHVAIFQVPCQSNKAHIEDRDKLASYDAGRARVIFPDMLVLAVGATTVNAQPTDGSDANTAASTAAATITVAVDQDEATILGGIAYPVNSSLFFVLKDDNTKIKAEKDVPLTAGACS